MKKYLISFVALLGLTTAALAETGYIAPYDSLSTYVDGLAGEKLTIQLTNYTCTSDVDLWVYDSHGNYITSDEGPSCDAIVSFYVLTDDTFEVIIENQNHGNGDDFYIDVYIQ